MTAPTRIALTGASGLLGTWLRRTAPEGSSLTSFAHRTVLPGAEQVDLRDREATVAAVVRASPEVVVHAAYALDEASIVDATRHVAEGADAAGAALVLISTDAVFDGDGRTRAEDDQPDPIWDYGRWKAAAEERVRTGPAGWAIVRLPLLVSLDPLDHVTSRIQASTADGGSTWFHDELRQPADAREVAEALWELIAFGPADRQGCWHLPGPELLSRFEIARRTARAIGLDPMLIRPEATPADAHRPRALVLGDDRARRAIGWAPSPVFAGGSPGT